MRKAGHSQSGYVLLLAVGILLAATTAVAVRGMWSVGNATELRSHRQSLLALQKAREDLVSFALSEDNTPGSMPCPATNASAVSSSCSASSAYTPGRFPFASMNSVRVAGANNECLWYAVSPSFRNFLQTTSRSASDPDQSPINPENRGSLILHQDAHDPGTRAIAILFDPAMSSAEETHTSGCRQGASTSFLLVSSNRDPATGDVHFYLNGKDRALAVTADDVYPRLARHVLFSLERTRQYGATMSSVVNLGQLRAATPDFDVDVLKAPNALNNACRDALGNKPADKTVEAWLCFNDWFRFVLVSPGGHEGVRLTLDTAPGLSTSQRCALTATQAASEIQCSQAS